MDTDSGEEANDSASSSVLDISQFRGKNSNGMNQEIDLGNYFDKNRYSFASQTKKSECDTYNTQISPNGSSPRKKCSENESPPRGGPNVETRNAEHVDVEEPFCHVKLESIVKLKDSTKKLLSLLEEIQTKTHTKAPFENDSHVYEIVKTMPDNNYPRTGTDVIGANAIRKLANQTKDLEAIYIEDDDDCSVYKRLTRRCNCLNYQAYNDLMIHFNEDTKYYTSTLGEIIKNMRIVKKFLYMGGGYTKNALMFLNEGLTESAHAEKVDIIQGVSHADVCNVFEDHSIVTVCISWPCKYENYGDTVTQALSSGFLYRMSELEEGRRYLKFSSKITNDIKKLLRKKASKLAFETVETLNATLNLLHPPMSQHLNVTYYSKPVEEGFGCKTIKALTHYREYMTLEEILTNLDLLYSLSSKDIGKKELILFLPGILTLFKNMLIEYDNSEMNIIITNILNNVMSGTVHEVTESPKTMVIADTATEPIAVKNATVQIPTPKKHKHKKHDKSKMGLASSKCRQPLKKKVSDEVPSQLLNRSKKFSTVNSKNPIIFVPIDE